MHVSVFIQPKERVFASSLVHEDTKSFSVTVRMVDPDGSAGEVALFADDAAQLLEFGRAIVRECETFPASAPEATIGTLDANAHAERIAEMQPSEAEIQSALDFGKTAEQHLEPF